MEALFALLQTPEGVVIIELLTVAGLGLGFSVLFGLIIWLFKDTREGRRGLHDKIDNRTGELHDRIDETQEEVKGVRKELHDHAIDDANARAEDARVRGEERAQDAERWGKVAGKLGIDD